MSSAQLIVVAESFAFACCPVDREPEFPDITRDYRAAVAAGAVYAHYGAATRGTRAIAEGDTVFLYEDAVVRACSATFGAYLAGGLPTGWPVVVSLYKMRTLFTRWMARDPALRLTAPAWELLHSAHATATAQQLAQILPAQTAPAQWALYAIAVDYPDSLHPD